MRAARRCASAGAAALMSLSKNENTSRPSRRHASAFRADRRLLGFVGGRSSSRTWRAVLGPGVALILQASVLDSDAPLGLTLTNDLDVTFD